MPVVGAVTHFTTFELVGGILIALLTLRDVFDTVVVPGGRRGGLRIAKRLVSLYRPLRLRLRRGGRGITTSFGPMVLVVSFTIWMTLLALSFGMMAHALKGSFDPPLPDYWQAVYLVGSGLVTIGLSETDALGGARWVVLASGFCGLAVMTMAVSYLLEVQTSIADRDKGVLKLQTSAGNPPSALALLEKYAAIGAIGDLPLVLNAGRDWCAAVRQSHMAHPVLIYFRTKGTGSGWPASLGALLDLAWIIENVLELRDLCGRAALLREDGTRLAEDLLALLKIETADRPAEMPLAAMRGRLEAAGYSLPDDLPPERVLIQHRDCANAVAALADHLGEQSAELVPCLEEVAHHA